MIFLLTPPRTHMMPCFRALRATIRHLPGFDLLIFMPRVRLSFRFVILSRHFTFHYIRLSRLRFRFADCLRYAIFAMIISIYARCHISLRFDYDAAAIEAGFRHAICALCLPHLPPTLFAPLIIACRFGVMPRCCFFDTRHFRQIHASLMLRRFHC